MVYNEHSFLPLWLDYYGKNLGYDNLYIIDHCSDDGSTARIPGNVIKIPRHGFDDKKRSTMISRLHATLLECFDVVLYTDCDEFVLPRPDRYSSLCAYLQNCQPGKVVRAVGVDVMPQRIDLPPVDFSSKILFQRPYGFITPWESKPLISSVQTEWAPGFHECNNRSELDEDLWLFHLKYVDLSRSLERLDLTRNMEWSESGKDYGAHQRCTDDELMSRIKALIANQENGFLDELPVSRLLSHGEFSRLRQIPKVFDSAL